MVKWLVPSSPSMPMMTSSWPLSSEGFTVIMVTNRFVTVPGNDGA